MTSDKRRRIQKLVYFEDSKRGYNQLAKELEDCWVIASIVKHHDDKKYICVLEKRDEELLNTKSLDEILKYLFSIPLPSKKRPLLGDT